MSESSPAALSSVCVSGRFSPSFNTRCASAKASSHMSYGFCRFGNGEGGKNPVFVTMLTSKSAGLGCASGVTLRLAWRERTRERISLTKWPGDGKRSMGYMCLLYRACSVRVDAVNELP